MAGQVPENGMALRTAKLLRLHNGDKSSGAESGSKGCFIIGSRQETTMSWRGFSELEGDF